MSKRFQNTNILLMIRPVHFRSNEQTAVNNYYQQRGITSTPEDIQARALAEFDQFVNLLRKHDVQVIVVDDTNVPDTPDSIFPNNWISFHQEGKVGLYPMFAENRRQERRMDILEVLKEQLGYSWRQIIDFTGEEKHGLYLEGTGSLVLDRINRIAYAAISERTHPDLIKKFCDQFHYQAVSFHAYQNVGQERLPIYHTNVMMCVAEQFVVICEESIDNQKEKAYVLDTIKKSGKQIISIDNNQKEHFAGNMLQVVNSQQQALTVMSTAAYNSLNPNQIEKIRQYGGIVHSNLELIETLGGGSARCMMAEVFLTK